MDLDDLGLSIAFSSTTIPFPGVLHLTTQVADATTTVSGLPRQSPDFRLEWTTNMPLVPEKIEAKITGTDCGKSAWQACAVEQTYQGATKILPTKESGEGWAKAAVNMGATIRLVARTSYMSEGDASWYAYKNCPCAASPDFPKGTLVRVTKLSEPQKCIVVKINDFGPERDIFPERVIDLDKTAFAQLASTGAGVIKVKVEPLAAGDPAVEAYNSANPIKATTTVKAVVAAPAPTPAPVAEPEPSWEL